MNTAITFIRFLFLFLCILIALAFTPTFSNGHPTMALFALAAICGLAFGSVLIGIEMAAKRLNLRAFNLAILGLFIGYLLGQGILMVVEGVLPLSSLLNDPNVGTMIKATLFLSTIYLGMVITARAEEEFCISLPFIKLKPTALKKKDILIDESVLNDARLIDLASSGLLDHHLILPRFILNTLYAENEKGDETEKSKARRNLEVIKKLESMTTLEIRYTDVDFVDIKDSMEKMVKLSRMLDANILTADVNQIQQAAFEDVRVIKFQQLCNALKPLTQSGEYITIKIQRYGKEARQGVGYLDDGTMVVVNGGAEFIGESIKAQVLSVKHTSSGRMIFCNALEEHYDNDDYDALPSFDKEEQQQQVNESAKNYFTV